MWLRLLLIALIATAAEAASSAADAGRCVITANDCREQCGSSNCTTTGLKRSGSGENIICECSGCVARTTPTLDFPICCVAPNTCKTRINKLLDVTGMDVVSGGVNGAGFCVVCSQKYGVGGPCSGQGWSASGFFFASLQVCTPPPTISQPTSSPTTPPTTTNCVRSLDECESRCGDNYKWSNTNGVTSCICEPSGKNVPTCSPPPPTISQPTASPANCVRSLAECESRCGDNYKWSNRNGVTSCICEPSGNNVPTCSPGDTKSIVQAPLKIKPAAADYNASNGVIHIIDGVLVLN